MKPYACLPGAVVVAVVTWPRSGTRRRARRPGAAAPRAARRRARASAGRRLGGQARQQPREQRRLESRAARLARPRARSMPSGPRSGGCGISSSAPSTSCRRAAAQAGGSCASTASRPARRAELRRRQFVRSTATGRCRRAARPVPLRHLEHERERALGDVARRGAARRVELLRQRGVGPALAASSAQRRASSTLCRASLACQCRRAPRARASAPPAAGARDEQLRRADQLHRALRLRALHRVAVFAQLR